MGQCCKGVENQVQPAVRVTKGAVSPGQELNAQKSENNHHSEIDRQNSGIPAVAETGPRESLNLAQQTKVKSQSHSKKPSNTVEPLPGPVPEEWPEIQGINSQAKDDFLTPVDRTNSYSTDPVAFPNFGIQPRQGPTISADSNWLTVVYISQHPQAHRHEEPDSHRLVAKLGSPEDEVIRREIVAQMFDKDKKSVDDIHKKDMKISDDQKVKRGGLISVNVELAEKDIALYFDALAKFTAELESISENFFVANTIVSKGTGSVFCGKSLMATLNKPEDLMSKDLIKKIQKANKENLIK